MNDMPKDIDIPQIKPENIKQEGIQENNISNTPVSPRDQEKNISSVSQSPDFKKKKMGKKKKTLLISGGIFLVVLILLVVQGLMIFSRVKKIIQKGND